MRSDRAPGPPEAVVILTSDAVAAQKVLAAAGAPEAGVVFLTTPEKHDDARLVRDEVGRGEVIALPADPTSAEAWFDAVSRLLARLRVSDVLVDITGGRKPMSVGAHLAAEVHGARVSYLADDSWRELPSLRERLTLKAAHDAFGLAHFDAAAVLYERSATPRGGGAPQAIAPVSRAYQAWLRGRYDRAATLWPPAAGPRPALWDRLRGRIKAAGGVEQLDEETFGTYWRDRARALGLAYANGHEPEEVAFAAWGLIESTLRWFLIREVRSGMAVLRGAARLEPERFATTSGEKVTLGVLVGLVCDGRSMGAEPLTVEDARPSDGWDGVAAALRALRRDDALNRVRNGLAHGFAEARHVSEWTERALGADGALGALGRASLGRCATQGEVTVIGDPEAVLREIARGAGEEG